ncbi:MAG TPA: cysteine synthase A [Treponemataceae bacterium]|nr:cysteine synthase A [Treponemataceae bacterium]
METIAKSITNVIGHTPLLELSNFVKKYNLNSRICAKLECLNPTGSVKDRAALNMIQNAISKGTLVPGTPQTPSTSVIIEETSGNTGIGLASIAASLHIRCICVMPENMSFERQQILHAYGAEVLLTPAKLGMQGAVDKVAELSAKTPNSFVPSQFDNPANPDAHYLTTGPEIWTQTNEMVSVFVSTIGTGGTICGAGKYLKEKNPAIKVVGVEPAESPLLLEGKTGTHGIQGIGANFIPSNYDPTYVDEVLPCPTEQAFLYAKEIVHEGILCGISSGAALWAAHELAKRPEYIEKLIVCVFPDSGTRYLTTKLYS